MTGSTHANHRSARSPRPTREGPAKDNPIAGPRMGTTRSETSTPASAGASGRHKEPGSRPASAFPAQPPSKAEGASPRGGERHHGDGKADRSIESDRPGRGAAHHAGPRGTPERHAAGHNKGTRTGAKQRRPPGATNPESAHNTQRTTAHEQVPGKRSVHTSKHTAQHPSQEWRGAAETRAQTHRPTPRTRARSGWVQAEHTHSPTPQPGVAGRSRNPSPNTHTHTAHPCQEWLAASGARTRIYPNRLGGKKRWRSNSTTQVKDTSRGPLSR